ncbi:inositol monophosphatase family protein [Candidatus Puniceispirillum marinum]|uniref:Putative Inositol monophosphatase family protein n=1 Tax=Puniceispirillum marinum (strain IMCC1322) TaxID=488538 RepID=D5BTY1_PUNMI|nr:inositol monophosphatase family protein [Candidatus Puniceispirillum marinum]ADE39728.1 putative Inositol monophosphatase family protein [Candidatus Puniceispirillum marinum IMCC1322]
MVPTANIFSATSAGQLDTDELALFLAHLTTLSRPIITSYFRALPEVMTKADSSPVTIADRSVEQALRGAITAQFPDDSIVGEEFGLSEAVSGDKGAGSSPYKWVIDPIDGTKAFVSGKPTFGTLVGVTHNDRPIAGLIDMPVLDETYIGTADGSTLNGDKLSASEVTTIAVANIATTSPEAFSPHGLAAFNKISAQANITNYGGDCHNFGLLAAGYIDAVIEDSLAPHDIMGVVQVMRGAGAIVTDFDGNDIDLASTSSLVCAGTAALHQAIIALIQN